MNRFASALAVALAFTASAQAQSTFNVTTAFTSACKASGTAADLNFGAYTAFGSAATATPTTTVSFQCTRGLTLLNAQFDSSGTVASASATGTTPTAAGVIAGLTYTLSTTAATKTTAGAAATASAAGGADIWSFTVAGAMAANQAGCTGTGNSDGNCISSQTRTLTITY